MLVRVAKRDDDCSSRVPSFLRKGQKSRFQLYKERKKKNPMQKAGHGDGPGKPGDEHDEEDEG